MKQDRLYVSFASEQRIEFAISELSTIGIQVKLGDGVPTDLIDLIDQLNCICVLISRKYLRNWQLLNELDIIRKYGQYAKFPVLPFLVGLSIDDTKNVIPGEYQKIVLWLRNILCIRIDKLRPSEVAREIEVFMMQNINGP